MRRPRSIELHGLGVALVAVLCYIQTVSFGFVSDDNHLIFNHPCTQRVADWPRIFTTGHYDGRGGYRPLTTLSFAINYLVGGRNPAGYHLVNIALHALNSALVLLLLDRLLRSRLAAIVGALIFAVHPVHSEAVAWISGRAELLASFFFLLAWLYHLRGRHVTGLFAAPRILSCLAFFAALLSKENALIFPVAIVLGDILVSSRRGHWDSLTNLNWPERVKRLYCPSLAVVAFYFLFRWTLYARPLLRLPEKIRAIDNPLVHASTLARLLTALKVQGEYLWLLVWPKDLCADYSFNSVPLTTSLRDSTLIWTLLIGAALALVAGYSFRRQGRIWLGLLFYALAVLPASNLLTLIGTIKAERLLYLPSVGFCLCAGLIAQNACERGGACVSPERLRRLLAVGALLCLVAAGLWRTWQQNEIWRDEETLWKSTAAVAPDNLKAQLNYGHQALTTGQIEEAVKAFRQARHIDPQSDDALINLGTTLMQKGENSEAILLYQEGIQREPRRAAFHLNLGLAYLASGKPASGVEELQRTVELEPDNAVARFDLGLALSKDADPVTAIPQFERAIALQPGYAEAWNALGASHFKLGHLEEAGQAFGRALQLKPGYADALYNMKLVEQAQKSGSR